MCAVVCCGLSAARPCLLVVCTHPRPLLQVEIEDGPGNNLGAHVQMSSEPEARLAVDMCCDQANLQGTELEV